MMDEEYIAKLKRFNSTDKYFTELEFLFGLIQPYPHQTIIDYGCGIGTAVKYFRNITENTFFIGFDVVNYTLQQNKYTHHYFTEKMRDCDILYFMHSFAHIPNISRVLFDLREKVERKVIVITPNAQWLKLQVNENYVPDPTVVQHYTHDELVEVFEDAGYRVTISGGFGIKCNNQHERLFLVAKP